MLPNKAAVLTVKFWTRAGTACRTKLSGHSCCPGKSAALCFSRFLLRCGMETSTNGIQPWRTLCSGRRLHLTPMLSLTYPWATACSSITGGCCVFCSQQNLLPTRVQTQHLQGRRAIRLTLTSRTDCKLVEFTLSRAPKFDSQTLESAREVQTRESQPRIVCFTCEIGHSHAAVRYCASCE